MTPDAPASKPASRLGAVEIADEIARMIGRRDVAPGERLREQALADHFGVSRGPVREALNRLAVTDLVRIDSNRGAVVPHISDSEVIANAEMIGVLMGLAARRAAERATKEQTAALLDSCSVLQEAMAQPSATADDYIHVSRQCFRNLVLAANSRTLGQMLRSFMYRGPAAAYVSYGVRTSTQRRQRARQWALVGAAVRDGRPASAEAAARKIQALLLKAILKLNP